MSDITPNIPVVLKEKEEEKTKGRILDYIQASNEVINIVSEILEEIVEELQAEIVEEDQDTAPEVAHAVIWRIYKQQGNDDGGDPHAQQIGTVFSLLVPDVVNHVRPDHRQRNIRDHGDQIHRVHMHGLDADGVADDHICGGKQQRLRHGKNGISPEAGKHVTRKLFIPSWPAGTETSESLAGSE